MSRDYDYFDNNRLIERFAGRYVFIDDEQREFFHNHIKRSNVIDKNSSDDIDDEAVALIVEQHFDELVLSMQNHNANNVSIAYFRNGDVSSLGNIRKNVMIDKITAMHQSGKLQHIDNVDKKVADLQKLVDFKSAVFPELFTAGIDGQAVRIDTQVLKSIILDNQKYDFTKPEMNVFGFSKEQLCYILKSFIQYNNVQYNFALPQHTQQFIDNILNDKFANTYHFNKIMQTNDDNVLDVVINDDLKKYVFDNMPKKYSDIEKAIFVYIKLCKLLTYDPEFYANNQAGGIARIHEDIGRLATISPNETRVVCYEFTQLYARFLFDLGLNYEVDGGYSYYGDGHSNLKFRAGEYIISADSVTSILGGDMYNAKINGELVGLICNNRNQQTKGEFKNLYDSVYDDIIRTEELQESDEGLFYDFLDMFDSLCEKEEVSMEKKQRIFEKRCKEIQLPTMDKLSYMLKFSKAIFEEELSKGQFEATIVAKKDIDGYKIKTLPTIVYSFNRQLFKSSPSETEYMMMDNTGTLRKVYRETLEQSFSTGAMRYITAGVQSRHLIPGLGLEDENVK